MLWWEVLELAEQKGCETCDVCPLSSSGDCSRGIKCYGGSPVEPPCCSFDDDDDVGSYVGMRTLRNEVLAEEERKERQAKQRKHEAAIKAANTRREMRHYCCKEITALKQAEANLQSYTQIARMSEDLSVILPQKEYAEQIKQQEGRHHRDIAKLRTVVENCKAVYANKRKEFYAMRKQAHK